MKRRLFSAVCVIVLILCACFMTASAAEDHPTFDGTLTTSTKCLDMIKSLEGYIDAPRWDVAQYSIGYGCSTDFAKNYGFSSEYLSKSAAHELMCYVVDSLEAELLEFIDKHGITLNQYQFDALLSLTYNVGTDWMDANTRLAKLLISGEYTVNEFASAFGIYCHIGTGTDAVIDSHLVSRRIQEIKLFLYGAYNLNDVPEKFCRINFDAGDGSPEVDVAFYQQGQPYQNLFGAESNDGTYFIGWYTKSGERVTAYSEVTESMTLYAEYSDVPMDAELWYPGDAYEPEGPELGEYENTGSDDEDDEEIVYDYNVSDIFSDMSEGAWYFDYVNDLYNRSVINGYEDATFRPERTVTTGEALKMILLAAGYWDPDPVTQHWASGYHHLALDEGIIDSGDIVDLDVPITRELMAKIAANALDLERLYDGQVYSDTDNKYACALYDWGISEGYEDGTFRLSRSLTRAELSAIVWRINNLF